MGREFNQPKVGQLPQHSDRRAEFVGHGIQDLVCTIVAPKYFRRITLVTNAFSGKRIDRIAFIGQKHQVALAALEKIAGMLS